MAQIVNTSGYKFIELSDLVRLKEHLSILMHSNQLKGTILLSDEGVNITISGLRAGIDAFYSALASDKRFADIDFKESFSDSVPFEKTLVRIKPEIITMGVDEVAPEKGLAKHIKPREFMQWLDQGKTVTVLDTRNDYEIQFGTFENAVDLDIENFREFPQAAANQLDDDAKEKPLVMFCTGGVRCEKAAIELEQQGFKEVYQLEGGILRYFEECDGKHWQGDCFVFDDRVALNKALEPTGAVQCKVCAAPVTIQEQESSDFVVGVSCPHCVSTKKTA